MNGSSAGDAAWIFLARSAGFFAVAPLAGTLIDKTHRKKEVLLFAIFMSGA